MREDNQVERMDRERQLKRWDSTMKLVSLSQKSEVNVKECLKGEEKKTNATRFPFRFSSP